jgi:tetratricopeptide (TPR) repeat protein
MGLKQGKRVGIDYNNRLMTLPQQIAALEASGLIQVVQFDPDLEYVFRHALLQDAAYESVLKSDRRRLHGAVGEVLERAYTDRLDEVAAVLGHHFEQAGDDVRAVKYYSLAGETAARQYALPEAITYFSKVIDVRRRAGELSAASLRQRGLAQESLGQFEAARADYEEARDLAAEAGDAAAQWQALLDLGLLWAGRDYAQTREYYEQAYRLATVLADRTVLAHTLNRLGNWHLNLEQPLEAGRYHEQALEIFEAVNDTRGVAETVDLLGMTNFLSCDMVRGRRYYDRAQTLFETLGDRRGLSSALATLGAAGPNPQGNTILPSQSLPEAEALAQKALQLAAAVNWRAGEAYALFAIALCVIAQGDYERALRAVESGLATSQAIHHLQWMTALNYTRGIWHWEVGDPSAARDCLEQALTMAETSGSLLWKRCVSGQLATVYVGLGEPQRARNVLEPVTDAASPALTIGHRLVWHAWADLALAAGDAAEALRLADWLASTVPHGAGPAANRILRLAYLRAQALLQLGLLEAADAVLRVALPESIALGARPMTARLHLLTARSHRRAGRSDEAASETAAGRAGIESLASSLKDVQARQRLADFYLANSED